MKPHIEFRSGPPEKSGGIKTFFLRLVTAAIIVDLIVFSLFSSNPSVHGQDTDPASDSLSRNIAFSSITDDNLQIYSRTVGNPDADLLSDNKFNDIQPSWSPDGEFIAFVSDRDGNNEICVMKKDGSDQHCLTDRSTPDGKPDPKLPEDSHPTWSPDGNYIAFVSTQDGRKQIYVMSATGGGIINISNNEVNEEQPIWSPDGKSIAFISDRGGNPNICVMDASGYNQRCLTNNRTANRTPNPTRTSDFMPTWSPDSSKIAFVSTRDHNLEIYVMNRDGSFQYNLTHSLGDDTMPAWSPDGQFIIFTSDRDGGSNLYIMNADGSNQRSLTSEVEGDDYDPAWAPLPPDPDAPPTRTWTPTPRVKPPATLIIRTPVPWTNTPVPTPVPPTNVWYPPTVPPTTGCSATISLDGEGTVIWSSTGLLPGSISIGVSGGGNWYIPPSTPVPASGSASWAACQQEPPVQAFLSAECADGSKFPGATSNSVAPPFGAC